MSTTLLEVMFWGVSGAWGCLSDTLVLVPPAVATKQWLDVKLTPVDGVEGLQSQFSGLFLASCVQMKQDLLISWEYFVRKQFSVALIFLKVHLEKWTGRIFLCIEGTFYDIHQHSPFLDWRETKLGRSLIAVTHKTRIMADFTWSNGWVCTFQNHFPSCPLKEIVFLEVKYFKNHLACNFITFLPPKPVACLNWLTGNGWSIFYGQSILIVKPGNCCGPHIRSGKDVESHCIQSYIYKHLYRSTHSCGLIYTIFYRPILHEKYHWNQAGILKTQETI